MRVHAEKCALCSSECYSLEIFHGFYGRVNLSRVHSVRGFIFHILDTLPYLSEFISSVNVKPKEKFNLFAAYIESR